MFYCFACLLPLPQQMRCLQHSSNFCTLRECDHHYPAIIVIIRAVTVIFFVFESCRIFPSHPFISSVFVSRPSCPLYISSRAKVRIGTWEKTVVCNVELFTRTDWEKWGDIDAGSSIKNQSECEVMKFSTYVMSGLNGVKKRKAMKELRDLKGDWRDSFKIDWMINFTKCYSIFPLSHENSSMNGCR